MTTLYVRIAMVAALLLAGAAAWWRLTAHYEAKGYARAQAEARVVAEAQEERNRDLQRASELRYTVATEARDRFIVTTVREIHDAAAPLVACPVPESVRLRLNAAAACASGDPAAACLPGDSMRSAP